jgi:hypothetical protein
MPDRVPSDIFELFARPMLMRASSRSTSERLSPSRESAARYASIHTSSSNPIDASTVQTYALNAYYGGSLRSLALDNVLLCHYTFRQVQLLLLAPRSPERRFASGSLFTLDRPGHRVPNVRFYPLGRAERLAAITDAAGVLGPIEQRDFTAHYPLAPVPAISLCRLRLSLVGAMG